MARGTFKARLARGFTLVEIIIVIVLLSALGLVGSYFIIDNVQTASLVSNELGAGDQGRLAIERIAREIREMDRDSSGYLITTPATSPYTSSTYNTLTFKRLADGKLPQKTVTIQGTSGTNVTLQYDAGPAQTLVSGTSANVSFTFLDPDGYANGEVNTAGETVVLNPLTIGFVKVVLTFSVNTPWVTRQGQQQQLTKSFTETQVVQLRIR